MGHAKCTDVFVVLTIEIMICGILARASLIGLTEPWFALRVLVLNPTLFVNSSVMHELCGFCQCKEC